MKLKDVPNEYKVYTVIMSNKDTYILTHLNLMAMIESEQTFIQMPNEEGFNKNFVVNWKINIEETKNNVLEHKDELTKKQINM